MAFDQLLEWDGHLFLDGARVVDVTADVEELGSCVTLATEASEPVATAAANGWCDGYCLDVGDGGWTAKETDVSWEGWLETWLSLLAFERLDQSLQLK